jgi:hypothetical protein
MAQRPAWEHVLLATEHTEFDAGAERMAIEISRRSASHLTILLPITTHPELVAAAPDVAARLDAEAAARRAELLSAAKAAGIPATVRVRGDAELSRAIVTEAATLGADLVVFRSRGRRGWLARLLVGETAGTVAARTHCDVLLVPRAAHPFHRGVLAVTDASAAEGSVAAAAARIAAAYDLRSHTASVAGSLSDAAREAGADLVVLGRGDVVDPAHPERLTAAAAKTIGQLECPVLIVSS